MEHSFWGCVLCCMRIMILHDVSQKLAVFSLSNRHWCWSVTEVRGARTMLVLDYVFYVQPSANNAAASYSCVMGRTYLTKRETVSFVCVHPLEGATKLNPLKMNRICVIQGLSAYRAVNTLHHGCKDQSVNAVKGKSCCLFSDPYKTHKCNVHSMQNFEF